MTTNEVLAGRISLARIMLAAACLGFVTTVIAGAESREVIKITGPKQGGDIVTISGIATGFPPGVRLRGHVKPGGDIFYSQVGPRTPFGGITADETFELDIQLGRDGQDYGHTFTVIVFAYKADLEEKWPTFGAGKGQKRVSGEQQLRDELLPFGFNQTFGSISKSFKVTKVRK